MLVGYHPGTHHPVPAPQPAIQGNDEELLRQIADLKGLWQLGEYRAERHGHDEYMLAEQDKVRERDATIESLRRQLDEKPKVVEVSGSGLPAEFDFGRRVYQCEVGAPGVGYRNTPKFSDKVSVVAVN